MRTMDLRRIVLLLVAAWLVPLGCEREAPPPPPATKPASQPATAPATKPTTTYVEVLRDHYPKFPATQPLDTPADLKDAGHYLLPEPIYLCPRGDLWITRSDAPPTIDVLKKANDEQIHITRERVRYVQWTSDEDSKPLTRLVVQTGAAQAWVDADHVTPIKRTDYRWESAILAGSSIVVPAARGVGVFTFSPEVQETYQEIVTAKDANPPQVLLDPRGVLAWSPWNIEKSGGKSGGAGAWRYVDGKWSDLSSSPGWSEKFVHLVPLLDGSVLQLIQKDDGKIALALSLLDAPAVDEKAISDLIDQLSDDDPDKREAANAQLTRYGPASWPILEKKMDDQAPEAQLRIKQLLHNRIQPTLGGRTLVDGAARVVDRFDDGGILLYAAAGVSIPQQDKPPQVIKPAWISIRPGLAIELVDPVLIRDADPDKQLLFAFDNEWIIADATQGPRRLFGNHLEPMLSKNESAFTHVIGYDRRGRWLFQKAGDEKGADAPTLVLDPTLPDTTPKLPVWLMLVDSGSTGWTSDGWPAIKRGGAWALGESGWRPLNESKEPMITKIAAYPPAMIVKVASTTRAVATTRAAAATSTATTSPSTASTATTQASTQPIEAPILVDRDGGRWFDGRQSLHVIEPDGKVIDWPLPATAAGDGDFSPVLLRTNDGLLFLFNQPGRVVRIKRTPDGPQPFAVESVFTHRVPSSDAIRRIWLDPAGRIVIAYENNRLAIMFPGGRIPTLIATMIPANEMDRQP